MSFSYQDQSYRIKRYPPTTNRSLQAWGAADEYLLNYLSEQEIEMMPTAIWQDRFGFLGTVLHGHSPYQVITHKSQETSLRRNLKAHQMEIDETRLLSPLATIPEPIKLGLIRIPKSLDLYRLYLRQAAEALTSEGIVLCGFMTRHFSPQMLKIAEVYFETVEQSRAWKKSRLMILKGPKKESPEIPLTHISLDEQTTLQQYPGVFSSNKVDPATRMLIDNLRIRETDQRIMDLGAGNGVIAVAIHQTYPDREIHLLDDAVLAIESARLNLQGEAIHFYIEDTLAAFPDQHFDLVVTNPPFHVEHENNIEIALRLFDEVACCLKKGGHFQVVANQHLNYKTHLARKFHFVKTIAENTKFCIYECLK